MVWDLGHFIVHGLGFGGVCSVQVPPHVTTVPAMQVFWPKDLKSTGTGLQPKTSESKGSLKGHKHKHQDPTKVQDPRSFGVQDP